MHNSPEMKGETMTDQVVYTSKSRIERVKGPLRRAYLPETESPVLFGVHSEIAEHYGVDPDVHAPQATTLDYVVAAAAGWLTGTFGGALEARKVSAGEGVLASEAKGEIEKDGNVLVIKRIHVTYHLKLKPEQRETAEKVHGFHADFCPVARSIKGCIDITTELQMEDVWVGFESYDGCDRLGRWITDFTWSREIKYEQTDRY